MQHKGLLRIALLALLVLLVQGTWALADTTGGIEGKVTDQNGNAVSGARVTVTSPSQHATATTASNGFYAVLNLSPDTYSVTATKDGYDTSTVYGITVQANQSTAADVKMHTAIRTIGHVTTTATASIVSKTVTGDLYAVNAQAIARANGNAGGAETLYSQNSIVGSLPGVTRYAVGAGPGYGGQGQLSIRGGAPDQVGYELEGVPLNRGFDFYNGTSFNTNGLASLEVYTGGAPADSGRAMSGYINEIIQRGSYPGGASFTASSGTPLFSHSLLASVWGGTPNNRFTYYVSTLGSNNYVNFGNRSNNANLSYTIPAGDPGCGPFNFSLTPTVTSGHFRMNCAVANSLNSPVSQGAYASTPYNALRDTATNLHWTFAHNGLNDDLQMLYIVGTTASPPYGQYGTPGADIAQASGLTSVYYPAQKTISWPAGSFYQGQSGQPWNPALQLPLSWPTSGGSIQPGTCPAACTGGPMTNGFNDSESTQYSIQKVGFTRSLTQDSFLRITGYTMYSAWNLDQPTNFFVGGTFYQLHDNATGLGINYQNQLNSQNLVKVIGDWSRDLTLRYNYAPSLALGGGVPTCATATPGVTAPCTPGATVATIQPPFSTWNNVTPLNWDGIVEDAFKPNDKWEFDLGLRWDQFLFQLMPQQITGPQGIAYLGEQLQGQCLFGYAYSPADPKTIGGQNCFQQLSPGGAQNPLGTVNTNVIAPGGFAWTNPPSSSGYTYMSPRFGMTFDLDPRDVIRASAGRYVQAPNSAFEQYTRNPAWGPGAGISLLNSFMTGLGFGAYHNVLPEDSTNYDMSFEHQFNGGMSAKLTPYYRNTRNQVLSIPFNPASPSFVTGDNFGNAQISGVEFALQKTISGQSGIGGYIGTTYTNSVLRFNVPAGGNSTFIDVLNGTPYNNCTQLVNGALPNSGICGYNNAYNTHFALENPNALYPPSFVMSPGGTAPSYDVHWTINFSPEFKSNGFDVWIPFQYQSGNPYGDPLMFADNHCPPGQPSNASTGCVAVPSGINPVTGKAFAYYGGFGPDPYTGTFDSLGSLKGPSWWTAGLQISHDIGRNLTANILGTNLLVGMHNQGYAWEQPANQHNIAYSDNSFYSSFPLGGFTSGTPTSPAPNPLNGYYGANYYGYSPSGLLPMSSWIFQITMKM